MREGPARADPACQGARAGAGWGGAQWLWQPGTQGSWLAGAREAGSDLTRAQGCRGLAGPRGRLGARPQRATGRRGRPGMTMLWAEPVAGRQQGGVELARGERRWGIYEEKAMGRENMGGDMAARGPNEAKK